MIRVLLGQKGKLVRGAIAAVLSRAPDLTVVAQLSRGDDIAGAVRKDAVDIAVLDARLPGVTPVNELCEALISHCPVLLLTDPEANDLLCARLARLSPRVGFIATESSPDLLVESVRRVVRGEAVLDTALALAILTAGRSPLTRRECEVLGLAAEGLRTTEIAEKLFLSAGTVRNHLSRILTKTGARTRIAAIRTAQEKGWI